MRIQIESLLRVIAVCFICVGAVRFTHEAFEIPLQRLGRMMLPPPSEGVMQEFDASKAILLVWRATPAIVGVLLILFRGHIASIIGPDEGWPLILGRSVIVVGVGMAIGELLDRVFNHAEMALRYDRGLPQVSLWFDIIRTSIVFLPLGLLWLLMRRMTTTCTNHAVEPTTKA